jgi:hypothetical protein
MSKKILGRDTSYGKPKLHINKNNTFQKDNGDACESCALELVDECMDCDSPLINTNDRFPNNPGYDLECSNPKCHCVYQVKGYGTKNHSQLTSDYILKQAGAYKTMLKTMTRYDLRYIVLFYDDNKRVVRSVLTGIVTPQHIVCRYGQNSAQCRIEFYNNYDVEYV